MNRQVLSTASGVKDVRLETHTTTHHTYQVSGVCDVKAQETFEIKHCRFPFYDVLLSGSPKRRGQGGL